MEEAADPGRPAGLEQAGHPEDVAVEIGLDVLPAPGQPGHRRLVDHRLDAVHDRSERIRPQVELVEREPGPAEQPRQVALLDLAWVVVGERVETDDLVAVREEALADVGPDEAGDAGDEDAHGRQA